MDVEGSDLSGRRGWWVYVFHSTRKFINFRNSCPQVTLPLNLREKKGLTMMLNATEVKLIGTWIVEGGKVLENDVSKRIKWLAKNYLLKLATDVNG
ncbi:hypothetical protein ACD591_05950 [Rufibacter glacialis]|uniref:Uncharacterized protein n=1 Tax=Rufibacter glacialis TaxID=1259555 RepID=A0A5M8QB31_9BACT|nr:hypothetical protein [Rufibacter glacialis]KAA6433205.1 hypothetical protein FOE74_12005 [Rufibacter glacialis]GGK76505.1 hypothetical protein GCM10011405_25390 [Rufibacter glacialis]